MKPRTRINADGGYARARASGKVGWGGNESDYDDLKNSILASFSIPVQLFGEPATGD